MPHNPPPGPGWTLGEDGHWKPPPFDLGGGPRPAPPAPSTAPPPPPAGGRNVGAVLAVVGVTAIAVVGLLVGAVTFLGTSSEDGTEDVGLAAPTDETGGSDPSETVTTAAPAPPATLTDPVSQAIAEDLAGGEWYVAGSEELAPQEETAEACVPDGWLTGAAERRRTYFGRTATDSDHALTVSLTAYADEAAAQAEVGRARSQVYADCEVRERLAEVTGGATDATATPLPDDPTTPGVVYQVDLIGGTSPLTEYEFTIAVGRMRAHLDFCGCADLGLEGQRAVAQAVARHLAEGQGLPAPG